MSLENSSPLPAEFRTQRRTIQLVMVLLVVMAALVVTVVPKLPLLARLLIAASDLVGAAVLGLIIRQKFSGK
jgi:hypothetical protein